MEDLTNILTAAHDQLLQGLRLDLDLLLEADRHHRCLYLFGPRPLESKHRVMYFSCVNPLLLELFVLSLIIPLFLLFHVGNNVTKYYNVIAEHRKKYKYYNVIATHRKK